MEVCSRESQVVWVTWPVRYKSPGFSHEQTSNQTSREEYRKKAQATSRGASRFQWRPARRSRWRPCRLRGGPSDEDRRRRSSAAASPLVGSDRDDDLDERTPSTQRRTAAAHHMELLARGPPRRAYALTTLLAARLGALAVATASPRSSAALSAQPLTLAVVTRAAVAQVAVGLHVRPHSVPYRPWWCWGSHTALAACSMPHVEQFASRQMRLVAVPARRPFRPLTAY